MFKATQEVDNLVFKQEIQLLKKVKIPNSYIQILQNQDYQTETLTHTFRNIVRRSF